jgi:hypothetical protein
MVPSLNVLMLAGKMALHRLINGAEWAGLRSPTGLEHDTGSCLAS